MAAVGGVVADRFKLLASAATGGMGRVYRARDLRSGEDVALKLLLSERNADRFLREARILAELHGPSIPRYVDHGRTEDGELYLVMEWLSGEDLQARLDRGPLSIELTLAMATRVAQALAVAHARGIVHRDVKPTNIFLPGGRVDEAMLLDFGIARWRSWAQTTGAILGTPSYMAPEQARGLPDVDPRTDVFALGCVLYECLVGQPTFGTGHPMAVLAKVLFEPAPRARDLRPEIPAALDALLERALAKDPARRPADGATLLAELAALDQAPHGAVTGPTTTARLGQGEQSFLAVVVARPGPQANDEQAPTLVQGERSLLEQVRAAVERFGGAAELLVEGSIVVVLTGAGTTAMDRATQAARCALAMRQLLPEAPIVLTTGRGAVTMGHPIGEVVERAAALFRHAPGASEVVIDDVTAGLLDGRFAIRRGATLELDYELGPFEARRTLLGRPTLCVGRDRELGILAGWFEECAAEPRSRAVVVSAPAGTGKSRLAYEFRRRLGVRHQGTEVWIARADPTRAGAPFGMLAPLVHWVAGMHEGEPAEERQRKLGQHLAPIVDAEKLEHTTTFLAELVGVPFAEAERPLLAEARRDAKALAEHMRRAFCAWLAGACATRPVMMVLEDLHWGDPPTVKFVESALRELRDRPLFVLALARLEIDEVFPNLWAAVGAQVLRLDSLGRKPAESLVRRFLREDADSDLVERIVAQAGGNAFFLEELIRAASEGKADLLPETVLAMAATRIEQLQPHLRRVIRGASVFGEVFWPRAVAGLVDTDAPEVARWLEELAALELVTPQPSPRFAGEQEYAFRHGLVREAAYAMLTDDDREIGHRLAGEWLAAAGESSASVLAEHFERGGDPERARVHYARAAGQALEANDFHAVLRHGAKAIALGAAGDLLRGTHERRGAALMALGLWPEAPKELRGALALVPEEAREQRADLHLRLARACFFAFDVAGVRQHAEAAALLLDGVDRPELAAEATAAIGIAEQASGDLVAASRAYARARVQAGPRYFASEAQLLLVSLWQGDVDLAIERGRAFVAEARRLNDIYALMVALPEVALGLAARGRYEEAQRVFDEARDTGRRYDAGPLTVRALAMSAGYRQDVFDLAGAEAIASEALEASFARNYPATSVSSSIDLLVNAARAGQIGRAEAMVAETGERVAKTQGQGWHGWLFQMRFAAARAELALARGDAAAALPLAAEVLSASRSIGRKKYQVLAEVLLGQALVALGRRDDALAALRAALDGARRLDDPGLLLRATVPLLATAGDDALLAAGRAAVERVAAALPEPIRSRFRAAEALSPLHSPERQR